MTDGTSPIKRLVAWTQRDVWRIRLEDEPRGRAFFLRWIRILLLSFREFTQDRCSLRASALTFFSVMSIVPLAAMAFGIAQGFGFEERLENLIRRQLPGQEEVIEYIINFSHNQLQQTRGGIVAGIGVLVLFWTVIRVMSNIERSFNHIWGLQTERSLLRKFGDYITFVVITPIAVLAANSLTLYTVGLVSDVSERLGDLGGVGRLLLYGAGFLPGTIIWMLFAFVYSFMPNTKVNVASAIVGGVVAGTLFQLVQWGVVNFQIYITTYSAIYGSFAALPLFLLWMQASWLIVLYGAELSFAHQNVGSYEFAPDVDDISLAFRRLLALGIVQHCVKSLLQGDDPPDTAAISGGLGAPKRVVDALVEELVTAGILAEASTGSQPARGYLPARSVDDLTIAAVLRRLDERGGESIPLSDSPDLERLRAAVARFQDRSAGSEENLRLRDLVGAETDRPIAGGGA